MTTPDRRKFNAPRLMARFVTVSWRDLAVTIGPILLLSALAVWATIHLVRPAPPDTITMTVGPRGSSFWTTAEKYRAILARNGVKLVLEPSDGSLDNLRKLSDNAFDVDIGFVQGGLASNDKLVSLGSMFYVPVAVFYRGKGVDTLADLRGKKIAIGTAGSGTRQLALVLLKANGITPDDATRTSLEPLAGDDAAQALRTGRVDAAFLTGDSATGQTIGKLMRTPNIHVFDFKQADAYVRRFSYLDTVELPMGVLDFGKNLPEHPIRLIAPTVELIARDSLHPALSDLLIDAAREVHGRPNLLQKANAFPAPLQHDFPISDDASRYYKSGKSFLYRMLPFWLASLADRVLVLLVPLVVILIPGMRLVPGLYRWRVKSRIYRWYGALISIERGALAETAPHERDALLQRLDEIEAAVNRMKMPLAFADQFYVLREHIGFVRARLLNMTPRAAVDSSAI